ncbi:MAG: hypothetical protein ACREM8_09975 [Vulcanimicrobiaceae bacterium]
MTVDANCAYSLSDLDRLRVFDDYYLTYVEQPLGWDDFVDHAALASLPGFTLPGDVSGSDKYFESDIVAPPIVANNGEIVVPAARGLGYAVDAERIAATATRSAAMS